MRILFILLLFVFSCKKSQEKKERQIKINDSGYNNIQTTNSLRLELLKKISSQKLPKNSKNIDTLYFYDEGDFILKSTVKDSVINIKEELKKEDIGKQRLLYDTLSIEQVKFNKNPFYYKKLSRIKAKVDSIKNHNWECGNPFGWDGEIFESKYINGAEFVSNKNTGEGFLIASKVGRDYNILTLNITGNIIKINNETTVNDIEKLFPNSETIDLPNDYYTIISMSALSPDDHWKFYYDEKGFLIRFELYWWLC